MFKIIKKEDLTKDTVRIVVEAHLIAAKAQAGQFVVLIVDEKGERIPLTLSGWDRDKKTITLIFQKIGYTTKKLGFLNKGDSIAHILGPLGHPTEIKNYGTVVCIGGGVGIAEIYPVSRALREAGNHVISIVGARSKDLLILENEMRKYSDELFITTDDGSYSRKGFVTDVLKEIIGVIEKSANAIFPALVYAIGPVPMMKAVCNVTEQHGIKTIVSLNPVMVDATGMCASCRCTVDGKTVYGCVDGPDFDGHKVDFDQLQKRLKLFENEERTIA